MTKKDIVPASIEDEVVAPEIDDIPLPKIPAIPPLGGTPRRAPGQKEVIPFAWKVCGYSFDGHTLTLFKSVDRADSEAHLARLEAEGYYDGLQVYPVNEKIPPSPQAKKRQADEARKAKTKPKKSASGRSTPVKTSVFPNTADEDSALAQTVEDDEPAPPSPAEEGLTPPPTASSAAAEEAPAESTPKAPKSKSKPAAPKAAGKKKVVAAPAKKKPAATKATKKKASPKKKSKA